MKILKIVIVFFALLLISLTSYSQDKKPVDTKVADVLAQLPASDIQYTNKLMNDILSLGDAGMMVICDQVIPLGSGDDIRPRFAVESLSRYLSLYAKGSERIKWEQLCIS
jgi:hypothetical protein